MTMLTRWDPFREMNRLQRDLAVLWGGSYGRPDGASGRIAPPCDVQEQDERFVVTMDAPGLDRPAIDVRVEGELLTVRGTRTLARDEKLGAFHLAERSGGSFTRSFTLPATVDAEKVVAEYREGVLTVMLPKRAEARPRQIEVTVA